MKLAETDIHSHFKIIRKVNASRVPKTKMFMTHIKSGIKCMLLFDCDNSFAESAAIISQLVHKEPMCKWNK